MWTFKIWPTAAPDMSAYTVFDIDATPLPEISVTAGTTFLVSLNEMANEGKGFGWDEPVYTYTCVNVLDSNWGSYNTGYRVWMLEAKGEECEEVVPLVRPTWWTAGEMTGSLNVKVTPVPCDSPCEIGRKRASATSCECIPVETIVAVGTLY
jgi:hypothetical protein